MRLSLGAIQYLWPRQTVEDFYQLQLKSPVDIIYLGETVCAKRRFLKTAEWIELAKQLAQSGKQIVLSTLTLIEARSDMASVKRLCNNGDLLVEANDIGAVQLMAEQTLPFVGGPSLNIYNAHTLKQLYKQGLIRWVMPVELDAETLKAILADAESLGLGGKIETEVFSFGRMPLAYSARCFTARYRQLPKDDCQLVCQDYAEGLPMDSQEGQAFFTINGIQTQSGRIQHLLPHWQQMQQIGVDIMRLSPQPHDMNEIVQRYAQVLNGESKNTEVESWLNAPACDGYWSGQSGMDYIAVVAE
ncbi:U32 family peptidase [Methylophaga nitratireducenticrescens]|uniref:Ubiquinone biosynthesis protein UbiV n=1 Tax=Methylophaga nitratireducenticrescens TaxID=754476 RepID=I1XG03_METNJ|nr:U32 family peptidase [Methylophaga nitratireducenticrescens]AFI83322.1 U32 family peptidase [Methylophaga nitratireducenticrescens]AUZ83443.1 U32 family peptidase [Methylophaga nitratireducenticrescens]